MKSALNTERSLAELRFGAISVRLARLFSLADELGVQVITFKGLAAALYYPDPIVREFSDIDIAVKPGQLETFMRALRPITGIHGVDFHSGFRHLDSLSWDELYGRSSVTTTEHGPVRTLCREDHFRVLAVHWLNDGGRNRGRLADLKNLLDSRHGVFGWERCLEGIGPVRRSWIAACVGILLREGYKFSEPLPFTQEELSPPKWFLRALDREVGLPEFRPLYYSLDSPQSFALQVRRRFPPNPIQAAVEGEVAIGTRLPIWAIFKSLLFRCIGSARKIFGVKFSK